MLNRRALARASRAAETANRHIRGGNRTDVGKHQRRARRRASGGGANRRRAPRRRTMIRRSTVPRSSCANSAPLPQRRRAACAGGCASRPIRPLHHVVVGTRLESPDLELDPAVVTDDDDGVPPPELAQPRDQAEPLASGGARQVEVDDGPRVLAAPFLPEAVLGVDSDIDGNAERVEDGQDAVLSCASFSTSSTRGRSARGLAASPGSLRPRPSSHPVTQHPHRSTATSMTRPSASRNRTIRTSPSGVTESAFPP